MCHRSENGLPLFDADALIVRLAELDRCVLFAVTLNRARERSATALRFLLMPSHGRWPHRARGRCSRSSCLPHSRLSSPRCAPILPKRHYAAPAVAPGTTSASCAVSTSTGRYISQKLTWGTRAPPPRSLGRSTPSPRG